MSSLTPEMAEETLRWLNKTLSGNSPKSHYSRQTNRVLCCITPFVTRAAISCVGRCIIRLQMVLEKVALNIEDAIEDQGWNFILLTQEINQLRLAPDYYLLTFRGGVCALVGDACCVHVNDSSADI